LRYSDKMRGIGDRNILDDFCIKFSSIVEKHCKYIVVSGFVAISSGRSRATEDIDMIIERLNMINFGKMHQDLIANGFVCIQSEKPREIYDYLKNNVAVRYTLKNSPLPDMEVKFAKDELDMLQIQSRTKLLLTGIDVWFSNVNMNIAFKEELLKSDKDIKDAEHLRKIYPELIDEPEIREYKRIIREKRL